jgi:chaperonin GroEL (HSP60 family)
MRVAIRIVRQITGNAGLEGAIIIEKIRANKDANYGFKWGCSCKFRQDPTLGRPYSRQGGSR